MSIGSILKPIHRQHHKQEQRLMGCAQLRLAGRSGKPGRAGAFAGPVRRLHGPQPAGIQSAGARFSGSTDSQ